MTDANKFKNQIPFNVPEIHIVGVFKSALFNYIVKN